MHLITFIVPDTLQKNKKEITWRTFLYLGEQEEKERKRGTESSSESSAEDLVPSPSLSKAEWLYLENGRWINLTNHIDLGPKKTPILFGCSL
jgi:hypothetical protein